MHDVEVLDLNGLGYSSGQHQLHLFGKMVIEVTQIEVHLERLSETRYSFQCHPQIVPLLQLMESGRVTKCALQ